MRPVDVYFSCAPGPQVGDETPTCCPEGVLHFCDPIADSCIADLDESPYKLSYSSRSLRRQGTAVYFDLEYRSIRSDCGSMAIDSIVLFMNGKHVSKDIKAQLGGVDARVTTGSLGASHYVSIDMSGYRSVQPNTVAIYVPGDVWMSDLCIEPTGSGSKMCTYVLKGARFGNSANCCPQGYLMSTLPSGRHLLEVESHDSGKLIVSGVSDGELCSPYDATAACFAMSEVEISESFDEGVTYAYKLTRTSADESCPAEFQVVVSGVAMRTFKEGHGHIWGTGGMPSGDHFSWELPSAAAAPVGTTTIVSFTLKGDKVDRLSKVCTVNGKEECVVRFVGKAGCFKGTSSTTYQFRRA